MSADPSWKGIYKAAGLSLIIDSIILILFIPLAFFIGGALMATTGKKLLESLSGNSFPFLLAIASFAISSSLNIAVAPGLYFALRERGKTYALLATLSLLMGTSIFLVSSMIFYAAGSLSSGYFAATTDVQASAYIASADLLLSVVNATMVLVNFLSAFALILYSIPMIRGIFDRRLGYLGILAAFLRIAYSLPGLSIIAGIYAILFFVWSIGVGWKLYRLS